MTNDAKLEPQWIAHNPRYPNMPVAADAWVQVKGEKADEAGPPRMAGSVYWGDLSDCDYPVRWYRMVATPSAETQGSERDRLTRPIIGIENRTPQEVFDIMSDRIRLALRRPAAPLPMGAHHTTTTDFPPDDVLACTDAAPAPVAVAARALLDACVSDFGDPVDFEGDDGPVASGEKGWDSAVTFKMMRDLQAALTAGAEPRATEAGEEVFRVSEAESNEIIEKAVSAFRRELTEILRPAAPDADKPEAVDIVPTGCTGSSLSFEPGVLHVSKDGSGYIAIDEKHFSLEDDRCEGDGPEGSVHWITRLDASEVVALRDFLTGAHPPKPDPRLSVAVEALRPFAEEALEWSSDQPDNLTLDQHNVPRITIGDCRRAATALRQIGSTEKGEGA